MGILKKGNTEIKLAIKIDEVGKTRKIELTLPDSFEEVQDIYYFKVNDDTILVSGGVNGSSKSFGLWKYKIKANIWKQEHTSGQHWNSFQMVGNDCLIGADSSYGPGTGILLYDSDDDTVKQIYEHSRYWHVFMLIDNKWYISGTAGKLVRYEPVTKTIIPITFSGTPGTNAQYYQYILKAGNKYLLSGGEASIRPGVISLDTTNDTAEYLYPEGIWHNIKQIGDNFLIYSSGITQGILLYKPSDNTITLKYTSGNQWKNFIVVGNNCLISSTSTSYLGILLYDSTNETITKFYEEGYGWNYNIVINNIVLISSTNSAGILSCNMITKNIIKIYDSGTRWAYSTGHYRKIGENILITSYTSNLGLLEFNISNNSITKIFDSNLTIFIPVNYNNKQCCLLSSTSSTNKGIWLYQPDTNSTSSVTQIFTTGYDWRYSYELNDNQILISASYNSGAGLLLFDKTKILSESISTIFSTGNSYKYFFTVKNKLLIVGDRVLLVESFTPEFSISTKYLYDPSDFRYTDTFKKDINDNIEMRASNITYNNKILQYDSINEIVKVIGCDLGEI